MKQDVNHQNMLARARIVLDTHRERLLSKANVVGVGVGLQQTEGHYTDTIALIVLVTRKLPPEELAEADLLPEEIEGFPVDVQETGRLNAMGRAPG
ncbi:MAG: hypothetical protein HPY59_09350 [Anaerolineae bacterium]|nr:hypothetical protein [Anaerolineae bacterium]